MRQVVIVEVHGVESPVHQACCIRALGHRDWHLLTSTSMPAYELAYVRCLACGEALA